MGGEMEEAGDTCWVEAWGRRTVIWGARAPDKLGGDIGGEGDLLASFSEASVSVSVEVFSSICRLLRGSDSQLVDKFYQNICLHAIICKFKNQYIVYVYISNL